MMADKPFWDKWVLDVTLWPDYVFVPFDERSGKILVGLSVVTEKSPGELIGVLHLEGQEEVEVWVKENPDWYNQYKKEE